MGRVAAGRISHAEREATVARLSDAYSRGELTLADFTRALDRAYAALTADDLDLLQPALPAPLDADGLHFAAHLLPGERVYWTGRPDPRRHFNPADWFAVPFSLMWASFAFVWEAMAIDSGPFLFMIWGVPFIAMGLYVTVGRFLRKAWLRRRTRYALTNLRALELVERRGRTELEAAFLANVPAVNELVSRGYGTVVFGNARPRDVYLWDSAGGFGQGREAIPLTFFDIPDAPRVLELAGRFRAEAIARGGTGSG